MDLDKAIEGMLDAQAKLRSRQGINSPAFMSEQMARMAQYTGAIEDHLANYESAYEIAWAETYKRMSQEMKPTAADNATNVELAEVKAKIKKLSRYVASSWRQIGVIQSRHNHLSKEQAGQI